jgi:hypothetical protein
MGEESSHSARQAGSPDDITVRDVVLNAWRREIDPRLSFSASLQICEGARNELAGSYSQHST